jgi:two-component system, NarL family, nitrate/nitrite response regulator NarL
VDPVLTGQTVRVLVVDDHPVVVQGVNTLARNDARIAVVGDARTAGEAVDLARELAAQGSAPHVVLLDLRLPDMLAPESIRLLKLAVAGVRVLIFTAYAEHPALQLALDAGADGALLKDATDTDVVEAIVRTARGETVVDARLRREVGAPSRAAGRGPSDAKVKLTAREYEILRRVAMGETNPEIADALGLSRNTVKTYLQLALQKLGARNRVEAIIKAGEAGLL